MDNSGAKSKINSRSRLTPVESEMIQLFVQFSRAFGQPRSVAEIYGLLFVSHVPLTLQDLKHRLDISLGSTSQGLQILQELGAVRAIKIPNQRWTHYAAVAELRNLAGSFLRKQIATHLNDSGTRLKRMKKYTQSLDGEAKDHAVARVRMLESWQAHGQDVFPLLLELLGKG